MRAILFLCLVSASHAGSGLDEKALLQAHNQARAKHCAPPLTWSAKVASSAQKWANTLGKKCGVLQHSGGIFGENLAAGTAGTIDEAAAVAMWYGEAKHYSYKSGGFSMKTGHFTQVVWKGTRELGCGKTRCGGLDIWVCQYSPPGNVEGQYRENVAAPGCSK